MKKLLIAIIILTPLFTQAQSWQWGKRGGGFANDINKVYETVTDMATDKAGNLYTLARIYSDASPTLTGFDSVLSDYGYNMDLLLCSYSCDGRFRWKKTIGGGGGNADRPIALGADTIGNVYLTGYATQATQMPFPQNQPPRIRFDTDSTQPYSNRKEFFIVKYDTAGHLKWIRWPAPDSATYGYQYKYWILDMVVSKDGRLDLLCHFPKSRIGEGATSWVADSARSYILTYNTQGVITGLVKPQLNFHSSSTAITRLDNIRMARTKTGKFVVSGKQSLDSVPAGYTTDTLVMGGQKVRHSMFVGYYNSQWQLIWKRESNNADYEGFLYRPIASNGDIFLTGSFFQNSATFNGIPLINTLGAGGVPFVVKLDSLGNNKWLKCAASVAGTDGSSLIKGNNNNVFVTGSYFMVKWDSFTLRNPPNSNYDIFIAELDAQTGLTKKVDSLKGTPGYWDLPSAMTADDKGNVFVGGQMGADLNVNGTTLLSDGGNSDFFIAKYGTANCGSVVPLRLLSFTAKHTGNDNLLQWTTAQEVNVDRFEIEKSTDSRNFGYIGKVKAGNSGGHHYEYKDNEQFTANNGNSVYYRLRMVDKDGQFTYSPIRQITINPSSLTIAVYPNPAKDVVNIASSNMVQLTLTDQTGRQLFTRQCSNSTLETIPVKSFGRGVYILKVTDAKGINHIAKVVVE